MDLNLHQKRGLDHLSRVLQYYPMVQDGDTSVVGLTDEDWHVLSDTLFNMDTPRDMIPAEVLDYRFSKDGTQIELQTANCLVIVEMF
jgi:hypothetical protein